jgi:hypothetical protein
VSIKEFQTSMNMAVEFNTTGDYNMSKEEK